MALAANTGVYAVRSILVVACACVAAVADADCVDNGADHGRANVKSRSEPTPLPNPAAITVADILAWPVPYVPHVRDLGDSRLAVVEEREIVRVRRFVR